MYDRVMFQLMFFITKTIYESVSNLLLYNY